MKMPHFGLLRRITRVPDSEPLNQAIMLAVIIIVWTVLLGVGDAILTYGRLVGVLP